MAIKVAVIGAGAAGLAAARRLRENPDFSFVVYEQNESVGGIWVYDERTGVDEYGLPIHSSLYKNLRTNLPKEVMGYPGFPIIEPTKSYLPAPRILKFLREFYTAFNLEGFIKFRHVVRKVEPKEKGSGWRVEVENLRSGAIIETDFDAILVCNGHYEYPNFPDVPGSDVYRGRQIHSHEYRIPETFKGMVVVVIGAGPSGLDIGFELTSTANHVYLSHHSKKGINATFPENFSFKPDVRELSFDEVHFVDGTSVKADCVLYCTGYLYKFPFLSDDCGVRVIENHVQPLYKHIISIKSPTLGFIGLPFYCCNFPMFDLQVRFFLSSLTGHFKLPSEDAMLEDEKKEMKIRKERGLKRKEFHKMGEFQEEYYIDLAKTAEIEGLPPVLSKLHAESRRRLMADLRNFRNDVFSVVDDINFERIM